MKDTLNGTTQLVLDRVDIVTIAVGKSTGRRKLKVEDMVLGAGSQLPPQELATLGSKQTVSREILKVWEKHEARMRNAVAAVGVQILNGSFAVAKEMIPGLRGQLQAIKEEALKWRDAELPRIFDQEQDMWFQKHAQWAHILRPAAPTLQEMQVSMRMGYSVITNVTAHSEHAGDLHEEVSDLGDRLLHSVADSAETFFREMEKRPEKTVGRAAAVSFLTNARRKLASLEFLDPAAGPAVKLIDEHLLAIPDKGRWLDGAMYWQLRAAVLLLCDPDKVRKHGRGEMPVEKPVPTTLFGTSLAAPAPIQTVAVTPMVGVANTAMLPVLPAEDGFGVDDDEPHFPAAPVPSLMQVQPANAMTELTAPVMPVMAAIPTQTPTASFFF